jgi:hypothetical protein
MGKKTIVAAMLLLLLSSCATHDIVYTNYSVKQIGTDQDSVHTIIIVEEVVYRKIIKKK